MLDSGQAPSLYVAPLYCWFFNKEKALKASWLKFTVEIMAAYCM